ncbi:hypothetical protein IKE98_01770 [Candidatus Saccharibacteria bacterium]|nr:hypothetical protein [Candidatus Saccharibacteria bacterium]
MGYMESSTNRSIVLEQETVIKQDLDSLKEQREKLLKEVVELENEGSRLTSDFLKNLDLTEDKSREIKDLVMDKQRLESGLDKLVEEGVMISRQLANNRREYCKKYDELMKINSILKIDE